MNTQENVQTVKIFFAAMGRGEKPGLLKLTRAQFPSIVVLASSS